MKKNHFYFLPRLNLNYRKIPKISHGLIVLKGCFSGANFWWGLHKEGNLRFKIGYA